MRRLVLVVLVAMWLSEMPAGATIPLRWPCTPSSIYVQPDTGRWVRKAVEDWRLAFRPDWSYTSVRSDAAVTISVRGYDFVGVPMAKGSGVTGWSGHDGVFTHADVLISKRSGDTVQAYNVAASETQHVAGYGYEDDLPWGDHDGQTSLMDSEVRMLGEIGQNCAEHSPA